MRSDDREGGRSVRGAGDSNVLESVKKLQQQMNFLERKIDRLMEIIEGSPDRDRRSFSKPSGGSKPAYSTKDRKVSRGYSKDEDRPAAGYRTGKTSSSGKPSRRPSGKSFGKPFGKPSGKPFGKPSGKPFGKPGTGKKKILSTKKRREK